MRSGNVAATLSAILLSGCATQVFDDQRLASANAAESLAVDNCSVQIKATANPTLHQGLQCYLDARRQFFLAIKLTKMDLFDSYQQRVLMVADQADRREITVDQLRSRIEEISKDLTDNILMAYQAQSDQNERSAIALQAIGAGLQGASASLGASESRDLNCTTVTTGNIANTNCH